MRALRKIVFVNSAHIRYAEVRLDGNVHFIGTQGVGKSTLLRAILFFYNADKLHLGIPKEMKSFDEFYLPHANSYIVYEVEHEHGPFCVLTFRSSGRACYRFINAAYRKEWLIDANGEVTAEAKVIRNRLDNCYMSKIIDRYEQFRDIIYGNRKAVDKELSRFCLMETDRYQNIPRSIQNVFLNSRLDANFIKDIIIRSMDEEEANIDLGYFRRQVADFEQEYKDISCWYKGDNRVRKQADAVVDAYRKLLSMKQRIVELCGELNYAVRVSREKQPLLEKRIAELDEQQNTQKRLLNEVQQKYEAEKSKLDQEKGVVDNCLKRLKECKNTYAAQRIEEVLKRYEKEQALKQQLDSEKERLVELTKHYDDVTKKYAALRQNVENQLDSYRREHKNLIVGYKQENQEANERLHNNYTDRCKDVEADFVEKLENANNVIASLKAELSEIDKEIYRLQFLQPFREELESLRKQLEKLALREKELVGLVSTTEEKISKLQTEYEKQEASILVDCKSRQDENRRAFEVESAKLAEIDGLLARTKGSFYEWLEENKNGWEQNIGKIINEENVLYRTGLHPQNDNGTSLFGVRLDLVDLPVSVRKPTQLKEEKAIIESAIKKLEDEYGDLNKQQAKCLEDLKRGFSPKMKELKNRKAEFETELDTIPQKRREIQVKIDDFEAKAKQEVEARRQDLNNRSSDIAGRKSKADEALEKVISEKRKRLDAEEKLYNKAKAEALKRYKEQEAELQGEIKQQEDKTKIELLRLQEQENNELRGHGADTRMVEECRAKISSVEEELKYIESVRQLVYDYKRDKAELFDCEREFNEKKRTISDKLQSLRDKYKQHRQKYSEKLNILANELSERQKEKERIDKDLQVAESFMHDEILCPSMLPEARERETLSSPSEVVDDLKSIIVSRQKQVDRLKQSVNVFKANFSAKNTFNFRVELALDEDYLDFANNLDDFIINNKIEEYRRRTSERYVDILGRVSSEMGDLTKHESDVSRIIKDINGDFRERNFVGVIKVIELRSVPSSDKMVQLMKSIKDFRDENQFAMGEVNIFSASNRDEINQKAVVHLHDFMKSLTDNQQRQYLTLSDLFQLQFRIVENDNDTGWADKLSHVGSEGTDTLVKAMINIMLINVFKEKVSRKFGDFSIHCMMDEIGKLHPQNVKGILDFANARNILLINSSPTTYNVSNYRYTYLLSKDGKSQTVVHPLISQK